MTFADHLRTHQDATVRTAEEIAKTIGAEPVSDLERSMMRAHNLGSLQIEKSEKGK